MVVAFGQRKSVSKVVAVMQNSSEGVSQKEIIAATGLSERSVKYALQELKRLKLVLEISVVSDMRRRLYCLGGVFYADK